MARKDDRLCRLANSKRAERILGDVVHDGINLAWGSPLGSAAVTSSRAAKT